MLFSSKIVYICATFCKKVKFGTIKYCCGVWLVLCVELLLLSCQKEEVCVLQMTDIPVQVAFYASGDGSCDVTTRTSVDHDGVSVGWTGSDRVAVWAKDGSGSYVLDGQVFSLYGFDGGRAVFTSELSSAMPDGNYDYVVCYPVPESVSGTVASFTLHSVQDGRASGGDDIMVSEHLRHTALKPLPETADGSGASVRMKHLIHLVKFYLPGGSGGLNGESIEKIVVTMPGNAVGRVTKDLADADDGGQLSSGGTTVEMVLAEPLRESDASGRIYSCAAVFPDSYAAGEKMKLKVYSAHYVGEVDDIPLQGRSLQAGHATPVAIKIRNVRPYYTLSFRLGTNNLGENPQSIRLSAPSGCAFGDGNGNEFTYAPGGDITPGEVITFKYESADAMRNMGGRTVSLTYESEHAVVSQAISLPDLSGYTSYSADMVVPYLLYEDFASVASFSSNDEYKTSSTGDKDACAPFLGGWTGGRIGADAGHCIRIAARRESGMFVEARYPARVDSRPLARIKSPVDVEVSFSYGTNNDYLNAGSDLGQDIYIGYVTSDEAYSSSDTDGVFESQNSISTSEKSGSYTDTPYTASFTITNVPAGEKNRITWRNQVKSYSQFAGNTTCWFYLDNVKVKVKKK